MPRKGKGSKFLKPEIWDFHRIRSSSEDELLGWLQEIAPRQKVNING